MLGAIPEGRGVVGGDVVAQIREPDLQIANAVSGVAAVEGKAYRNSASS